MAQFAVFRTSRAGERIHLLSIFVDRQVHVGKLRKSGKPDQSQSLTTPHLLSFLHLQRAFLQVAILRAPAIAVIDDKSVAAEHILNGQLILCSSHDPVRHLVAHPENGARRGRQNLYAASDVLQVANAEICT